MSRHRWILATATAIVALSAGAQPALAQPERDVVGDGGVACSKSVATNVPQPSPEQLAAAGLAKFPVAPLSKRVDLVAPPFSNPTSVTNPLFPISDLHSAVINGHVDGKPLKIETTLLGDTQIMEWSPGQCVRTLISQFVAYLGGRIEEVALDRYAQDDAGSVWYFGEDVFNYREGGVADTGGTWLAGKEGPAAMIMPAHPQLGNVNRSENIPGLVFEEVTTKAVDKTVQGPTGPVAGAIIGSELHDDGQLEDKWFAPGYGEFRSAAGGDLEAMALAVPTDARPGPVPAHLTTVFDAAIDVYDGHKAAARRAASAWRAYRKGEVPLRLKPPMDKAIAALRRTKNRGAAIRVAHAALDLQLQFRPPTEIDRARLDLWARQVAVDAAKHDAANLNGDVTTMEWIRDRITRALDPVTLVKVDTRLTKLRGNVTDGKLRAAARNARRLRSVL